MTKTKYDIKRKELLKDVRELVLKYGYENLTVRLICSKLNLSTGNFYHYFPEKNYLVNLFFEDMDDFLTNNLVNNMSDDEAVNLLNYMKLYAKKTMQNGVEVSKCINVVPLNDQNNNYINEERTVIKLLKTILSNGMEKKQFNTKMSVDELTKMLLILIRGYNSDWAKCNGNYNLEEEIEKFYHTFIKAITI